MVARASALLLAALVACLGRGARGFTLPDETATVLAFKEKMLPLGPHWEYALKTWVCPTKSTDPDGSCDPCGDKGWWGIDAGGFDHLGCRGDSTEAKDIKGGDGHVTNIHITDVEIEGTVSDVAQGLCPLKHLKEFDVDGGQLTGPIPELLLTCFPQIDEIDLSYNQVTGTAPAFLGKLTKLDEFKAEHNNLTGTIPPEIGDMAELKWLRFADNRMGGPLPAELAKLSRYLVQLTLDGNDFSGNLYSMSNASLVNAGTADNPRLCGMVPLGVRQAHYFNPHNTGLGLPCPDELAGWVDLSEKL